MLRDRCMAALWTLAALVLAPLAEPARAQTAQPAQAPNLIEQLKGPDTPADIDVAALRQKAEQRIKSRADAVALRRPLLAPELTKLPQVEFIVVFDPDTAIIRPQSYQMIGRLADALSDPRLRPYGFLIVDHIESTGARPANLALSQKRADAIRSVLSQGFRVQARQLQALGLGEEQLLDGARPSAPANARVQIIALGPLPPDEPPPAAKQPAKKSPAKKRR